MEKLERSYWWSVPVKKLLEDVHVNPSTGLSASQVEASRKRFGSNAVEEVKPTRISTLIIEGIKEPMMLLLLSIGALSILFGKLIEAVAMVFVVIAYILVEFINKYRSDRIMVRLRSLTAPTVKIIREGKEQETLTKDLVVGDILLLSEGAVVPADARLIESFGLTVNEASLTGESMPIQKKADILVSQAAPLAERTNSVFAGTTVLDGEAKAMVMAVGAQSEFGKIAAQVQKAQKEETVLQKAMLKLARVLALFALAISMLIPIVGFLRGQSFHEMVLTWLALTFLMIPGQPPIIITMALALASFELARRKVIVKRLRGAEIAGQITAVVSDKTGTITENKMSVEKFILANSQEIAPEHLPPDIQEKIAYTLPLYSNDPTDKAIYNALDKTIINRITQVPVDFKGFSGTQPWRTLLYKTGKESIQAIGGKPELLIKVSQLSPDQKRDLEQWVEQEARLGKRVVAFALREDGSHDMHRLKEVQFIALAVLEDPVRAGVKDAIKTLKRAGITTFIVTGDHQATAEAIARQIGMAGTTINGDQLAKMTNKELSAILAKEHIFARTGPLEKLRIVKLLESQGEIVAAVGDGVNDAPALKAAQLGIAMGAIGTDLAKEVSDLVLTDDSYTHIPQAVAIGRKALGNFQKGLTYYLTAKAILLAVFLVPLVLGIPFPFAPTHIILIELLMDLASSTIFVTEAAEPDSMEKPAPQLSKYLSSTLIFKIIQDGFGLALAIAFIYVSIYYKTGNLTMAQTAAFVTWLIGHIFLALNLKQEKVPLIKQGLFSNRFGALWLISMVIFSLLITEVSALFPYMHTTRLSLVTWVFLVGAAFLATFWIEVKKFILYRKSPSNLEETLP